MAGTAINMTVPVASAAYMQDSASTVLVSTEEVTEYVRIAIDIIQLWQDMRSMQFPKVFGHAYPI